MRYLTLIAAMLCVSYVSATELLAQRVVRPPVQTQVPGPTLQLPAPIINDDRTLVVPTPVIPVPPAAPEAVLPDAGACCLCAGTNECSDACCHQ